jgi:hypothetical protein
MGSADRLAQLGDAVRVRGSTWVVTNVDPPTNGSSVTNHLVTLRSIGEDDQGSSLQVVWEVEPQRSVLDKFEIPTPAAGRWDDPARLDAFLRAVRWGSVTNADQDMLEAPYRSGIDLKIYQLEPLVRALDMSRALLLIADDVGLGKTIEAGLILQEFILRHRIRNALIVCPAGLVEKWQIEMRERFGVEFRVLDTAYEREVARTRGRHVNPIKSYPWLVTSIDWLKRAEREDMLHGAIAGKEPDEFPRPFDLLILDEAHLAAPAGANIPVDSQRTRLIDWFGSYFEHRLFLTATPHNGHRQSFWALLSLLDRVRFPSRELEPTDADVERTMVRRLKAHVKEVDPSAPFPTREIHAAPVTPKKAEVEGYELLGDYLDRLRELNPHGTAKGAVRFMAATLRKRFLSSPAAFANTIAEHAKTIHNKGRKVSDDRLADLIERAEDSYDDDDVAAEAAAEAVRASSMAITIDDEVLELLSQLEAWGETNRSRQTGRLGALIKLIDDVCKTEDGDWSNDRLIVFTEYRDTHKWLADMLKSAGVPKERIASMYGGMQPDQRSAVAQVFNRAPGDAHEHSDEGGAADLERVAGCDRQVRVLLATDTASEGIDLQRFCHHLLHFDVPYNPSRMEQRNGRIDRHGQPHPTADIHTFEADPSTSLGRDTKLENDISRKLATVTADVGSANPLFQDDLKRAHESALAARDDQALARYEALVAERRAKTAVTEGVERLRRMIKESDRRLLLTRERLDSSAETIAHLVQTALDLAGQPGLVPATEAGLYALPGGGGGVGLSPEWTDSIPELVDRMDGIRRLVTFDPEKAGPAPGPILLHLNHPFVAHAAALLRAQVWTRTTSDRLHRVTARTYDLAQVPGDIDGRGDLVVVAHARVLVTGGTHTAAVDATVLHEDVVARAARYSSKTRKWAQLRTDKAADALYAARTPEVPLNPDAVLESWAGVADDLSANLTNRAEDVANQLAGALKRSQERETRALREDAERIQKGIRKRIDEIKAQLDEIGQRLWEDEEKVQLERNFALLQRRVDTIRDDIDAEIAAVEARYDDLDTFVMPIALTFLHPEDSSRG